MAYKFNLQYDPDCISELAKQYMNGPATKGKTGAEADKEMEAAGSRIWAGSFDCSDTKTIYKWKSPRSYHHFDKNLEPEIRAVMNAAVNAIKTTHDPSEAIRSLTILKGIKVKVAMAFLTALAPKRFTVLDFRALESLNSRARSRATVTR